MNIIYHDKIKLYINKNTYIIAYLIIIFFSQFMKLLMRFK